LVKSTDNLSIGAEAGIVCEQHGADCQVLLSGRLTIDSSPGLREILLQQLQDPSCQSMTADFYEVEYVDTSGLAILVEILKTARIQRKTFHLSRLRERPRYLLEATRLLHLFDAGPDPTLEVNTQPGSPE
jgi:anti-sigma B factor antagonist